jgi:rhodanese-related sulfurtransferase
MEQLIEYAGHHPWLVAFAVAAAVAVIANEIRLRSLDASALPPQDVIRLMNQGAVLLDLRPAEAYGAGHINGARHMPVDQIGGAGESLKRYKERALILYCERGGPSAGAARQLVAQGFTKVFNLRGGVAAWRTENLPLARD